VAELHTSPKNRLNMIAECGDLLGELANRRSCSSWTAPEVRLRYVT
jgi:hypothetical protein